MTDTEWTPIFVLPNIPLEAQIGCDIAAIAPADDPRVVTLKQEHPSFEDFMNRFSDNFGDSFEPSVLILNSEAPPAFRDVTALASFRDLIALSIVTHSRAMALRHPGGNRPLYGDAFAIYPWMLDRDYEDMIGNTPAILGIHQLSRFRGQSSPSLFRTSLREIDVDRPLLEKLMERWRLHYSASTSAWQDIALMRSLNMAYHASLLPSGTETRFYDVGRLVSLWVSAFEILAHPGGSGHANRDKVFEMIELTPWAKEKCGQLSFDTGSKKLPFKRSLASWLYQKLYDCRNDFLHGNPVERNDLILPVSNRTVFEYAAPLYRIALTAFLPLTYDVPAPHQDDASEFAAYVTDRIKFLRPQRLIEEAILTATGANTDRDTLSS